MNIALDKQSTTKAILNVSIEKDDYQTEIDKKLREYSKKVQLKGFRPGKTPKSLIWKMYGKTLLLEEVNRLISQGMMEYIRENKLLVVGEPQPIAEVEERNDWNNPNPSTLEFAYELGLASDFEIDLATLQLTKYNVLIDEEEIDKRILNYRERMGTEEEVDSIEEEQDYVTISLHLESDGEELNQDSATETVEKPNVEEVTEEGKEPSVSLIEEFEKEKEEEENRKEALDKYLASFTLDKVQEEWKEKIKGLKKDDTLSLPLDEVFGNDIENKLTAQLLPEEWEMIRGKEVKFTIRQIDRTTPAEINEEFLEKILPEDEEKTEENLRNIIKEQTKNYYEKETDKYLEIQAKNAIIAQANIELPDEFLKARLIKNNEGKFSKEEVEEQYPEYAKYLKWDLIVDKISQTKMQDVESEKDSWVTLDDVKRETVKSIFAEYGIPYNQSEDAVISEQLEPLIKNYLGADNGATYQKMYNQASALKALKLAVEEAIKEEKEVSFKEYIEIIKNI